MSFTEFIKKNLVTYCIIVTGITVAIPVLGFSYDSKATFGYEAYFSPLLEGALALLPAIVLYSRKELTMKQMLIRRILHFILLEITLLGFGLVTGLLTSINLALSLILSVFFVYLFTTLIRWMIDSKTAEDINKGLKRLQD